MALKICPFCGNSEPKQPVSILGRWMVECGVPCGAAVRDYATADDAVMAWNRRIPASPVPEMEDKVPLVLYFATRADADEMVAAVQEAFPNRVWRGV